MSKNLLVQFAKAPDSGRVKTRMINPLSAEQAAQLHCQLTRHCLDTLVQADIADVQLWVGDQTQHAFFQALKISHPQLIIQEQQGQGLGERMCGMFAKTLKRGDIKGYDRVVLVGSDCPFIDSHYLNSAFDALDKAPVVIGPAEDGGYVLIGLRKLDPCLFASIAWGSSEVLNQTRQALDVLGWPSIELGTLHDIDRPEDLSRLAKLESFKPWLSFG